VYKVAVTPLSPRRLAASALAVGTTAVLTIASLSVPAAHADDAGTFTVVGTSDVFDSNLVQTILEPGFEAAYPQYNLQYVSKGTGAAIAYAQAGTASALIVHAAALENQFVADGYSLEPYGRAIFWGDYVLLGPANDPAGVLSGDSSYDIRHAFGKVAAAGAAGHATFVSRGGTPGTTVQEHAIWAETTGVQTCDVSSANGGGTSPSTATGACANPIALPDWYKATGLTQGPNVMNGDVCNYPNGGCYVFTDRGTFQYLQSKAQVSNLKLMTRPSATHDAALANLLVNSFHAYGINPAKFSDPSVQINTSAATAFLEWITSPATQARIGAFLQAETAGDPPFLPSAAPALAVTSQLPAVVPAGTPITVTGTVKNKVPGTPVLDNVPVKLLARPASAPAATPTPVATGVTNAAGQFSIAYTPTSNQLYSVATDDITKIENAALDPDFGDILQGTTTEAGTTKVKSTVAVKKARLLGRHHRKLTVRGSVAPGATGQTGQVVLYAAHPGKKLKAVKKLRLKAGATRYEVSKLLKRGTWRFQVRYLNPGIVETSKTTVQRVRIR